ncbi:hypothetical protein EJB05_01766, partial [Eragrostis curvula]
MSSSRRSSEENVKKKARIHKSSSKDDSEKVAGDARPQVSSAAVTSVPPSKVSATRSTSVKSPISNKALVMISLMDMVTDPKGEGQGSSSAKASLVCKDIPSKCFAALQKAKTQDKNVAAATTVFDAPGSKAKIQDKSTEAAATVLAAPGLEAKIQDKTQTEVLETSAEAQIQDKDVGEGATSSCLSLRDLSELRQIYANLKPHSDHSGIQLPHEPQIQTRDIVSPSRVEVAEGSSLACDEVPANTFVMSAQAIEPFVAAANRIQLPQVEDELMLQGGDTLYKSLLSSHVKSLAITHASLRQYRELSWMKADRDSFRKDLSFLETKVKEKEDALALSEKRLADLSSEKESLSKSARDFEMKVASLDKQVEDLDASLAKARENNEDHRGKVDAADQELAALVKAERLHLSGICGQIRDALVFVRTVPDQLPEDASIEYYQAWLTANIPYVVKACRTFSNNAVHLAVWDLLRSLEAGGSDALAKAVSDSFSLISTDTTPSSLVESLVKFADHIDEFFWSRVLSICRQPQIECATPESSFDVSLSEFAAPEPSSRKLARHEPPIEIFSSPSEIDLSSDSDPLSPIEGGEGSFTFPLGSLVAIGRVYHSGSDVSEGRHGRGKRGSRGCRSHGVSSSSWGSTRKKRDSRCRRDPPVDSEGPSSRFDAA